MALGTGAAVLALAEMVPALFKWIGDTKDPEKISQNSNSIENYILEIAKKITGVTRVDDAVQNIQKDRKLLLRFQEHIVAIEKELITAQIKDRIDARHRDLQLAKLGRENRRADVMIMIASLGLITCLVSLGYYRNSLPGEAIGIISTIAGVFGACLKDAFGFEFGAKKRFYEDLTSFPQGKKAHSSLWQKILGKVTFIRHYKNKKINNSQTNQGC